MKTMKNLDETKRRTNVKKKTRKPMNCLDEVGKMEREKSLRHY